MPQEHVRSMLILGLRVPSVTIGSGIFMFEHVCVKYVILLKNELLLVQILLVHCG